MISMAPIEHGVHPAALQAAMGTEINGTMRDADGQPCTWETEENKAADEHHHTTTRGLAAIRS